MKKRIYICLILILHFFNCFSQSAWQWAYPKPQGNITYCSWFFNANTGLIGTESGTIMKTTNSGISWSYVLICPGSPLGKSNIVNDMEFVNLLTGFAINRNELYKTTNSGDNWFYVDSLVSNVQKISFINSQTGLLAGWSGPISKTTDGGYNWVDLNVGRWPYGDVKLINETTGFVGTDSQKVYRTTNLGVNWQLVYSGEPIGLIDYFTFYNQNTGFAIIFGGRYIKTTNAGLNWTLGSVNSTYNMYSFTFIDSLSLFMFGENGCYHKSTNGGTSWTTNNIWNNAPTIYTSQKLSDNEIFIGGRWGLMGKSSNSGTNWISLSQNTYTYDNFSTIEFANNQYGFAGGGDFFKTTDGGLNWIRTGQICGVIKDIFFVNSSTGFVSTISSGIFKTTNTGDNWQQIYLSYYPPLPEKIWFINELTGISYSGDGFILRTTNGGLNWSKVDSAGAIYYHDICFSNINTGYVLGNNGILKRTTNSGINWQNIYALGLQQLNSISFIDNLTGFIGCENKTILKTTNGGINWSSFILPILFNSSIGEIRFGNQNNGLLILWNNYYTRVMTTTNGGNNWVFSQCLAEYELSTICAIDSVRYIIGGDYGKLLYTRSIGIVGVQNISTKEIPDNFYLYQNFPNPFNPNTNIKYQILKNEYVSLKVFDILGKEIITLVNDKQSPGTYEISFDGSNLSSGIYFYKLETNGFSDTKRMILLK